MPADAGCLVPCAFAQALGLNQLRHTGGLGQALSPRRALAPALRHAANPLPSPPAQAPRAAGTELGQAFLSARHSPLFPVAFGDRRWRFSRGSFRKAQVFGSSPKIGSKRHLSQNKCRFSLWALAAPRPRRALGVSVVAVPAVVHEQHCGRHSRRVPSKNEIEVGISLALHERVRPAIFCLLLSSTTACPARTPSSGTCVSVLLRTRRGVRSAPATSTRTNAPEAARYGCGLPAVAQPVASPRAGARQTPAIDCRACGRSWPS
jgi:hypothetical protein